MRVAYIVALVVLGVLLITAIAYFVRLQVMKRRERGRIRTACGQRANVTILLELLSYDDADAVARTLTSAFENASCALRVHAGVYELFQPGSADVVTSYERQARGSKSPYVLRDNVRTLRVPIANFKGVLTSYEQLERTLYDNETYVCMLAPGTLLTPNWDDVCVALLAASANPYATAITTVPGPKTPTGTHVAIEPISGAFMSKPLRARTSSAATVPALVCASAFMFSSGPARTRALTFPNDLRDDNATGVDTLALDYYITLRLLSNDWTFAHPVKPIAFANSEPTPGIGSADWRNRLRTANAPFLKPLIARGIEPSDAGALVSANATMGLMPNASDAEISAKLGSLDAFLSEKARLELLN